VSDEKAETIRNFVKKNGYTMPVYQDTVKAGQAAYKVGGIPVTVLLDKMETWSDSSEDSWKPTTRKSARSSEA